MMAWLEAVNTGVLAAYNTRIVGGFSEPFYRAAVGRLPAEIRFTHNYERSALHELAHWCIAGPARRQQDDYGYWYVPDGRTAAQQRRFFAVEVKPQAIEKHFCQALAVPFEVSLDNLGNHAQPGLGAFRHAVDLQFHAYRAQGLPARATRLISLLSTLN